MHKHVAELMYFSCRRQQQISASWQQGASENSKHINHFLLSLFKSTGLPTNRLSCETLFRKSAIATPTEDKSLRVS